jgi:hypothetical protein
VSRRTLTVGALVIAVSIGAGWTIGTVWPEASYPHGTTLHERADILPLCEESAERPCFSDFGDVTIYEDGSWTDLGGNSGCLPDGLCAEPALRPCEDEYEDVECVYTQGDESWYVDAEGVATPIE